MFDLAAHGIVRGGPRDYVLVRPFRWGLGKKIGTGAKIVTIPTGFAWESSVPRWARWFLDPHDPFFVVPALVHDFLLENGYSARFADGEWLDAARKVHAPVLKRTLAYAAMRLWRLIRK